MNTLSENNGISTNFYLNKWYLDFIGENGSAMIFYAAELFFYGVRIPFSSWLNCDSDGKVTLKSGFKNLVFPEIKKDKIYWKHKGYKIDGSWTKTSPSVESRIYSSAEGTLDWICYQPASEVQLRVSGQEFTGKGYAERLQLTLPVWKIPMEQLRWGHIVSEKHQLVWIEITNQDSKKWMWLNGEFIPDFTVNEKEITLPERRLSFQFQKLATLESEKKLTTLANKMVRIVPGIKTRISAKFLLANENKWLSSVSVYSPEKQIDKGFSIHELVDFNPTVQ